METKKVVVTIHETSQRTIEYQCEFDIPIDVDEYDYIYSQLEYVQRKHFVDIVDSEQIESEIVDVQEGALPQIIQPSYTIIL